MQDDIMSRVEAAVHAIGNAPEGFYQVPPARGKSRHGYVLSAGERGHDVHLWVERRATEPVVLEEGDYDMSREDAVADFIDRCGVR